MQIGQQFTEVKECNKTVTSFELMTLWLDFGFKAGLSSSANQLMTHLLRFYNQEKKYIFPHQQTLSDRCNMSLASVKRGLNELLQAGLIVKIRKQSGNRYGLTGKLFDLLNSSNRAIVTAQNEPCMIHEQIKGINKTTKVVSLKKDFQPKVEKEAVSSSTIASASFETKGEAEIPDILKKKAENGEIKNLQAYWRSLRPQIKEEYIRQDKEEKTAERQREEWKRLAFQLRQAKKEAEQKLREELDRPLTEQFTKEQALELIIRTQKMGFRSKLAEKLAEVFEIDVTKL